MQKIANIWKLLEQYFLQAGWASRQPILPDLPYIRPLLPKIYIYSGVYRWSKKTTKWKRLQIENRSGLPRFSISLIHISTTAGISVFWALTRVVKSMPNILFMYFMSGRQSFGTFSEHFLCAFRPQSEKHCNNTLVFVIQCKSANQEIFILHDGKSFWHISYILATINQFKLKVPRLRLQQKINTNHNESNICDKCDLWSMQNEFSSIHFNVRNTNQILITNLNLRLTLKSYKKTKSTTK